MAIALVTTATQVTTAASSSTAPSIVIAATGGNAITAFAQIIDLDPDFTLGTVTDGANTFTVRQGTIGSFSSFTGMAAVAHAVNITGGSRTVAFNLSGTSAGANRYFVLGALEWSGVATSAAEDTFDANADLDATLVDANAGPITTTDANDLIAGVAGVNNFDTALTWSSPASWTNKYRQSDANAVTGMDAGYWLPAAIQTTYTAQWAHDNDAGRCAGVVVALKPAAAGGAAIRLRFPPTMSGMGVGGMLGGNRIE